MLWGGHIIFTVEGVHRHGVDLNWFVSSGMYTGKKSFNPRIEQSKSHHL